MLYRFCHCHHLQPIFNQIDFQFVQIKFVPIKRVIWQHRAAVFLYHLPIPSWSFGAGGAFSAIEADTVYFLFSIFGIILPEVYFISAWTIVRVHRWWRSAVHSRMRTERWVSVNRFNGCKIVTYFLGWKCFFLLLLLRLLLRTSGGTVALHFPPF